MYRSRLTLALLSIGTVLAGCADETPVSPGSLEPAASLLVNAPTLTAEDLMLSTGVHHGSDPEESGPALAELDGEDVSRPLQQVIDPETRVGFDPGYAWSLGRHDYIGNVASVQTTATVAYHDQYVGSQTAKAQDYTPFLLDLGQVKLIWTWAKVYSDHECGLTVQGSSQHKAWWQFYQGKGTSEWGVDQKPSQAAPVGQSGCTQETGGATESSESSSGVVCTYFITYDLDTGEILNAELLYCTVRGPLL